MRKQFGAKAKKSDIEKYSKSKYWNGKIFENLEVTKMDISIQSLPKLLYKQFCKKEAREPQKPISIIPFNKELFLEPYPSMRSIWYGHSAILMRLANKTILIDPMFGSNAAPIAPFAVQRFSQNTLDLIDEFPEIDLVLLSHDHYDHLDFDSIQKLKSKTKQFYVALGVKRHLVSWGIPENIITEFDWWDENPFGEIQITFTPTRHFSGRGLTDRAKSLWGGWALKTANENILFSGDSGYGEHFKEIGKRLSPFNFAFMECGQYNENWHLIHMYPEESVQASIDANVKNMMPVHWAGFSLAQHIWTDPVERFTQEASAKKLNYCLPKIGELFDSNYSVTDTWWADK